MKTLTPACAAVFLLVGLGAAYPALATSTDPQELDDSATAIDVYKFTCPEEPPKTLSARARVEDLDPQVGTSALMRVRLLKDHETAVAQDLNPPPSGESTFPSPSPPAVLARGPGNYLVLFYKTAAGKEKYRGSVVCKRASGPNHNPHLNKTQDQ